MPGPRRNKRSTVANEVQVSVRIDPDLKRDIEIAALAYAVRQGYTTSSQKAFLVHAIKNAVLNEKRRNPSLDLRTVHNLNRKPKGIR